MEEQRRVDGSTSLKVSIGTGYWIAEDITADGIFGGAINPSY